MVFSFTIFMVIISWGILFQLYFNIWNKVFQALKLTVPKAETNSSSVICDNKTC